MRPVRRQLIIAGFTVLASGLLVGGLMLAGKLATMSLRTSERYQFPFKAIDCPSPPGMEREAFLGEVRYYGEFPESVALLDPGAPGLPDRLSEAFARHAWVEKVDKVQVGPGRRLAVSLTFRTPVLAVVHGERVVRAVDAHGVLLPRGADTHRLPHLTASTLPAGVGKPWGDVQVESAAAVAALLHPHQDQLRLTEFRWQGDDLHLRRGSTGADIVWGSVEAGERKLRRLLDEEAKLDAAGAIELR